MSGLTIDVGNVTRHTFNPPPGRRYYVAVRAYNLAGDLSEMSGEVVLDVPAANRAPLDNASAPLTDESVAPTYFIMSLHQVLGRNPDIARATGRTANGVTEWTANQCRVTYIVPVSLP